MKFLKKFFNGINFLNQFFLVNFKSRLLKISKTLLKKTYMIIIANKIVFQKN